MNIQGILLSLLLACICAVRSSGGTAEAGSRDWLQFRGDRLYTGRSSLKGRITKPRVEWSKFIGARETLVVLQPQPGFKQKTPLPIADIEGESREKVLKNWHAGIPYYDMDGNGNTAPIGDRWDWKYGYFLPKYKSLQRLLFTLTPQPSPTQPHGCTTSFSVRENGDWKTVWQNDGLPSPYGLMPVVGDFDGDGNIEYAVAPLDDLYVFDLSTGKQKAKARFVQPGAESGRSYGWLGAYDLNRDGKSEFVLIGDFQEHIEVLGWVGGEFKLIWGHMFERQITGKLSLVRPGTNPVEDVDGDGLPEITLSVFNEHGDNKWHIVSYQAMTGEVKYDLPDNYLSGLCDVNGDSAAELFCTRTSESRLIPEPGELAVVSLVGGKKEALWRTAGTSFQVHDIGAFPPNVNSCASMSHRTILTGRIADGTLPSFFTRKPGKIQGDCELTAWSADSSSRVKPVLRASGPHIEALSTAKDGVLLLAKSPADVPADLVVSGCSARALSSHRGGLEPSPAVAGKLRPNGSTIIVAQGADENLFAISTPNAKTAWQATARGMFTGADMVGSGILRGGVVLADLRGTGGLDVIAAARGPIGQARIVALDAAGKDIWHTDFDDLSGEPPPWNIAGITYWFAGRFTRPDACDVLVHLRVSQDTWTVLLDGRTGKEIWRRKEIRMNKYRIESCGGMWTAVLDCDGDGLDDALIEFHDIIYTMKGTTGNLITLKDTSPGGIFGGRWVFGGMPVVADFLGNGSVQAIYWGGVRALLDMRIKPIWLEDTTRYSAAMPGVGDLDGDGRLDLVVLGNPSEKDRSLINAGALGDQDEELHSVACRDGATNATKWTLTLPSAIGSPGSAATVDIDGDGRDECIFPIGCTLYCVGASQDSKSGELRWSLPLPAAVGPPAIVDTDGSGDARVIVICADGNVYCISGGYQ